MGRQDDLLGLLLLGDPGQVLRRRRQRDGLAADEDEEDDEDEAEEADPPVDAAAGGLRAPEEAAAAPAGRATTSCRGSRHQRFAATSEMDLLESAFGYEKCVAFTSPS